MFVIVHFNYVHRIVNNCKAGIIVKTNYFIIVTSVDIV